ncbi:MAG: 3-hydroxybutyryl-CoA dehydrogenase [Alphaproteobacteria bacterium]|nr:3-hydroxybutyryl-CoA dehydrogenase [Alphaproteobacteria bacterium]
MMQKLVQVVGAGQMGCGIAEVCLVSGYSVHLVDLSEEQRKKAYDRFSKKLTPEQLSHVTAGSDLLHQETYLIIEAIAEDMGIKKHFWQQADHCKSDLRASNTSSYSISTLAEFTKNPHQFIGIHFMNPVPKMSLVEVIKGLHTDEATYREAIAFVESLGKIPVTIKDSPGFVVNRILLPMINEAAYIFEEGVASADDIDKAMSLGAHHPLGPLALADLIGLDTCLAILNDLNARLGEKYRPCALFNDYINQGYLGKKSGRGFHPYT